MQSLVWKVSDNRPEAISFCTDGIFALGGIATIDDLSDRLGLAAGDTAARTR